MEFPWGFFFAMFTCLAGVLFAVLGAGTWMNKGSSLQLKGSIASIAALGIGIFAGTQYLGHPERIFGALGNPHSVLSRELLAILIVFVIMAVYLYQAVNKRTISKEVSGLAVVLGTVLAVATAQLVYVWLSGEVVIG